MQAVTSISQNSTIVSIKAFVDKSYKAAAVAITAIQTFVIDYCSKAISLARSAITQFKSSPKMYPILIAGTLVIAGIIAYVIYSNSNYAEERSVATFQSLLNLLKIEQNKKDKNLTVIRKYASDLANLLLKMKTPPSCTESNQACALLRNVKRNNKELAEKIDQVQKHMGKLFVTEMRKSVNEEVEGKAFSAAWWLEELATSKGAKDDMKEMFFESVLLRSRLPVDEKESLTKIPSTNNKFGVAYLLWLNIKQQIRYTTSEMEKVLKIKINGFEKTKELLNTMWEICERTLSNNKLDNALKVFYLKHFSLIKAQKALTCYRLGLLYRHENKLRDSFQNLQLACELGCKDAEAVFKEFLENEGEAFRV